MSNLLIARTDYSLPLCAEHCKSNLECSFEPVQEMCDELSLYEGAD